MDILIVGAGIAGTTLAHWLARYGHRPTLLEHAPHFRNGGYVIDFWGAGFDVADRMGVVPQLRRAGYVVKEVRLVDRDGDKAGGFSVDVFTKLTGGRYVSIPRGDLAATLYATLDDRTERIFGDEVTALDDRADGVHVSFAHAAPRRFDLVIGADGLHSKVRALAFGDEERFEKYLGFHVAAAEVGGYRPRDEDTYVLYSTPGQQVGRFALRGDRTLFLFVWRQADPSTTPRDVDRQHAELRRRFAGTGWEVDAILRASEASKELYFDRVSQIRMPSWTRGRVALVGDAAHCVSLLAGQGSALAMIGARVLAGELHVAGGDHRVAFARYEDRLRDFMSDKQDAAVKFAGSFAPRTAFGIAVRNKITKLMSIPFVTSLAFGRGFQDRIELPEYG